MIVSSHLNKVKTVIEPGEFYVTNQNEVISTLLGSCVAACLWDPVNKVIGMNHFLLASDQCFPKGSLFNSEAGRYGVHAMKLLIDLMVQRGAQKENIQAKAFGGANVLNMQNTSERFMAIGEANARFIKAFLASENIPLGSSHLGGKSGRIINFHAQDYAVYMKLVASEPTPNLLVTSPAA